VVNAGNYAPGPFAPNSILTLFGVGLARSSQALTVDDIRDGFLPTELNSTRVYVDGSPAPLFYVSDGQVNFLMPSNQSTAWPVEVWVMREGNAGPKITLTVVSAAPALFATAAGYAIATHADNSLVTVDAPAHANEVIVLYCTGLGKTAPNPATGVIPQYAGQILTLADLKVTMGGAVLPPDRIKYAGLSPGSAGLYQINLAVPDSPGVPAGSDPEIRVFVGDQSSPGGLKLAFR
jgi:uncharacterized protein (TIGR03437 family)